MMLLSTHQHSNHLKIIIKALGVAKLKAKPSKCQFEKTTVEFLGAHSFKDGYSSNSTEYHRCYHFSRTKNCQECVSIFGPVHAL